MVEGAGLESGQKQQKAQQIKGSFQRNAEFDATIGHVFGTRKSVRDPFLIDSPTCISFSGGRTSAYMLWRVLEANGGLPDEAVVCFANTGKEDEATLRFVRDCAINWQVPIAWVEYRSEKPHLAVVDFDSASRKGEPFEQLIRKRQYLPNPVARFCTQELKVLTIDRYLKSLGIKDPDMMVGVRADEPRRLPKLRARGLSVPLATAGVTQAEVQSFWKSQSFDLELEFRDGVTAQGNCDLCYLKGGHQIASMIAQQPERAVWWAKMERVVDATWRSDRPSYEQMLKFAQEQRDMFDPQEEAIACFCGD